MKINIKDYVNDTEIKETIIEELRFVIRQNAERILSNLAYYQASGLTSMIMDSEMKQRVRDKTLNVINELSAYTVCDKDNSTAKSIIDSTVKENEKILRNRVKDILENEYLKLDRQTWPEIFAEALLEIICQASKKSG